MTFWTFIAEVALKSWKDAGTAKKLLGLGIVLLSAVMSYFGFKKELSLAWIPLTFPIIAFIGFLFWHAFLICRQLDDRCRQLTTRKLVILDEVVNGEDTGGNNFHYRVRVKNTCGVTIPGCGARIILSDPDIGHTPIPLHCSHEIRPDSAIVALDPGQVRNFDVCRFRPSMNLLEVTGSALQQAIPSRRYRFRIVAHGNDCQPEEREFDLIPNDAGDRFDLVLVTH